MGRQMFAHGGSVYPMQDGGIAPMPPMPEQAPPAPMAPEGMGMEQAAQGAAAQGVDPAQLEGMLGGYQQQMSALDGAEDYETVINSIRGDELPMDARYAELAEMVGQEDASSTPESVLTLIQPVMQLAAVDQGIGGLAQDEMSAPIEGPLAGGIMSTVNMGAPEGPDPVNFSQGGPVRYMADAGVVHPNDQNAANLAFAKSLGAGAEYPSLDDNFAAARERYRSISGESAYTEEDLARQNDLTKAQMWFDLASTGLAFAAPGDRNMSAGEKLASAARDSQLFEKLGARAKDQETANMARKTAMRSENMQLDLAAMGSAEALTAAEAKARADLATAKPAKIETINLMIPGDNASLKIVELGSKQYYKLINSGQGYAEADKLSTKPPAAADVINFMEIDNPSNIISVEKGSKAQKLYATAESGYAVIGNVDQPKDSEATMTLHYFYNEDTKEKRTVRAGSPDEKLLLVKGSGFQGVDKFKMPDDNAEVKSRNWLNGTNGDIMTVRQGSGADKAFFAGPVNGAKWTETGKTSQSVTDISYKSQNFLVTPEDGAKPYVEGFLVNTPKFIAAMNDPTKVPTGDAKQVDPATIKISTLTFESPDGVQRFMRSDDAVSIDAALAAGFHPITTQKAATGPKATNMVQILGDQDKLDRWASGEMTGSELNEFEQTAALWQVPSSRVENGETITTQGRPFNRALVDAYNARVAAGFETTPLTMPPVPRTVSEATLQLRKSNKEFGISSPESMQILSNSVDPKTGFVSRGLLLDREFNTMLLNTSGSVNLDSPAWFTVPTSFFSQSVDYDLAQGLATFVPRVLAGVREITGQLGGNRINADDQMLYQADNDFGLLKMNTISKLQAGLQEGRILKRTNDMIFDYLDPLKPGVFKFDANTLATMESITKQLGRDLDTHTRILSEYGADPRAISKSSDEQIRKSEKSAFELRGMIAEFTRFKAALRGALDSSSEVVGGQLLKGGGQSIKQQQRNIYNLANPN